MRCVGVDVWDAGREVRCVGCDVLEAMCGSRRVDAWREVRYDVWFAMCWRQCVEYGGYLMRCVGRDALDAKCGIRCVGCDARGALCGMRCEGFDAWDRFV